MCGWNSTARDLIDELKGDDYQQKVVVLADLDKNPAGPGVYFVRGDATDAEDLERAGIEYASAALVFPSDGSDEADMHSILAIMAIKRSRRRCAPWPRSTTREHEPHFLRASVDELLVTSKVASRLLARSALYPGLSGIITDIVSGGEGSELYRITLPTSTSASRSTAWPRCCAGTTRRRCCRSTAAATPSSTRGPISSSRPATTRSSWPRGSARSRHSSCTTSTPPR